MAEKKNTVFKKVEYHLTPAESFMLADVSEAGPAEPAGDIHFNPQLIIVLSGTLEMIQAGKTTLCRSGEMCLTGPYLPHCARLPKGITRYLVITFDFYSLNSFSPFQDVNYLNLFLSAPAGPECTPTRRDRAIILSLARRIISLQHRKPSNYKTGQYLAIHQILWQLSSRFANLSGQSRKSIMQIYPALLMVQTRQNVLIPLDDAANACNLSRSRFSAVFKEYMGISFNAFALRGRLNAAARTLAAAPDRTMKDIALESGFSDVSHFYRAFRKLFHCTPKEFLDKQ